MAQVKALLVGAGSIGLRHLRNLRALGVEDVCVVDPSSRARARALQAGATSAVSQMPPAISTERRQAWDAILVCSPASEHVGSLEFLYGRTLLYRALSTGLEGPTRGLFVEKPLYRGSNGEAVACALDCERCGLVGMTACNMRFHPPYERLKAFADTRFPAFAQLLVGGWRPLWPGRNYAPAPYECCHELDLALWLLGPGKLTHSARRGDRTFSAHIEHESGAFSSLVGTVAMQQYARGVTLVFEDGSSRAANGSEAPADDEMYVRELKHFLDCVQSGDRPCCTLADGAVVAEMAAIIAGEAQA